MESFSIFIGQSRSRTARSVWTNTTFFTLSSRLGNVKDVLLNILFFTQSLTYHITSIPKSDAQPAHRLSCGVILTIKERYQGTAGQPPVDEVPVRVASLAKPGAAHSLWSYTTNWNVSPDGTSSAARLDPETPAVWGTDTSVHRYRGPSLISGVPSRFPTLATSRPKLLMSPSWIWISTDSRGVMVRTVCPCIKLRLGGGAPVSNNSARVSCASPTR